MSEIELSSGATTQTKLIELGNGAAIDDVFVSSDESSPISAGIFTQSAADAPFVYTYKYHEQKVILEGTIVLTNTATGVVTTAHAGDVLNIPKGTTVAFSSPNFGRAFYVGQRKLRDF